MGYRVAILGAAGTVGREILAALEERSFPVDELRLLAGAQGEGEQLEFCGAEHQVEAASAERFEGVQLALLSPNSSASRQWASVASQAGALVVDTSGAFRLDADVPLVVPEVNSEALAGAPTRRVVASPSSAAIALALALKPLHAAAQVTRAVVTTFQAVSGVGRQGVAELERQIGDLMNMREATARTFPHRVAFNVVPQIGEFSEGGATDEEAGIASETRKLLGAPALRLSATAVRVPVYFGHSASVNVSTEKKLTAAEARELLKKAPGLKVLDDPARGIYPMPMLAVGDACTHVGRVREDPSQESGLELFACIDNLRKGAALNAVQIAEMLRDHGLL
jgi:aspartate-semialdehyde dehydrogenase